MSIATIRRQVKNVAYNLSDAQVKVREATSNDPWGPSAGLMSEIADLSNNPADFTEIMSIIWKRLNDSGKNWRHVYKSLVLLHFLITQGSEKVAQQCHVHIYSIEALSDFHHVEDGRDQGRNVREKAKQLATLLQDDEKLRSERTRFMLARNRIKQSSGVGHEKTRSSTSAAARPGEYDEAPRSDSYGEEEMLLQMQIALALSKEEHEREEEKRKGEDVLYQLALEESRKEAERCLAISSSSPQSSVISSSASTVSHQSVLDDLLSLGLGQMTMAEPEPPAYPIGSQTSAWDTPAFNDPWNPAPPTTTQHQPSSLYPSALLTRTANDPWRAMPSSSPVAESIDWGTTTTTQAKKQQQQHNTHDDLFAGLVPWGEFVSRQSDDNLMGEVGAPAPSDSTPPIPPTGARTLLPQPLQPQPDPTNPFPGF